MVQQYRLAWPPFTKSVIIAIALLFTAWFLSVMIPTLGEVRDTYLLLNVDKIMGEYQVWTLFTHAWFEPGFIAVLFASVAVWLFGAEIEQRSGTKHFWTLVVTAILASGVVVALLQLVIPGAYSGWSAPLMALIAAYCWRQWNTSLNFFFIPLTGKTMLALFLGLNVVLSIFGALWLNLAAHLVGAAVGIALSRKGFGALRELRTRFTYWKARRHLKIVKSPEDDKPNGKSKSNGIDRKYMN